MARKLLVALAVLALVGGCAGKLQAPALGCGSESESLIRGLGDACG